MADILMIREATDFDIPAIVGMVRDLRTSTAIPMEIDDDVVARALRHLIASPQGLLLVAGAGPDAFLAASVGVTTVCAAPVAQEHGWWASPQARGAGMKLLLGYERWAVGQGCRFIRMSTPPHAERAEILLQRRGFAVAEHAWVKAV